MFQIYYLGDVCFGCSRPNDCIERLTNIDCINILGNNDFYACDHIPKADMKSFSKNKLEQYEYMKSHISEKNKQLVLSWDKNFTIEIDNKKF